MRALIRPGTSGSSGVTLLRQRLARLGVTDVGVITPSDPATELAAVAGALRGRTLLVDADLLVADACLGQLVADEAAGSGALVVDAAPVEAGSVGVGSDEVEPPDSGAEQAAAAEPESDSADDPDASGAPAGARAVLLARRRTARRGAPRQDADRLSGLSGGGVGLGRRTPVRTAYGRIISSGSAHHDVKAADRAFIGAFVVDAADRDHAAKVLTAAADTARFAGWDADPVDLALVALVRGQVPMTAVDSVGPTLRGGSAPERDQVIAALEDLDEAALRRRRSRRPDDTGYAVVVRRAAAPLTSVTLRLHLKATLITLIGLIVGLSAAASFAVGTWPALIGGAVLLQLTLAVERVVADVARLTGATTPAGPWLAAAAKPVTEFAAYAGLAVGAARAGVDVWLLAAAAVAVQTVRHVGDHGFTQVARVRETWVPAHPMLDTSDPGPTQVASQHGGTPRAGGMQRMRELARLHRPERLLLVGIAAVAVGPRWTLVLLAALGLLVWVATTGARIVRSLRWRQPPELSGSWLLAGQLDLGPIGEPLYDRTLARLNPLTRSLGWVWPMAMRAVELAAAAWVVARVAPSLAAWLFAWTAVVALHHHDLLHRTLAGYPPPRWLSWFGLGWEGRTILVLLTGWSGAAAVAGLLHVGTPVLALLFVAVSPVQWVRFLRRRSSRAGRA